MPSGLDPKILLLDLVIHRQGGIQGHIAWFEKLTFKMRSSGNAYGEVDILHGGNVVQRVKVEHPLTFAAPPAKKPPAKKRARQGNAFAEEAGESRRREEKDR